MLSIFYFLITSKASLFGSCYNNFVLDSNILLDIRCYIVFYSSMLTAVAVAVTKAVLAIIRVVVEKMMITEALHVLSYYSQLR